MARMLAVAPGKCIFLADSNRSRRERGRRALECDGHDVIEFHDGIELLEHLALLLLDCDREKPDVIITEQRVGFVSALTIARNLRSAGWRTALVVIASEQRPMRRNDAGFAVLRAAADPDDLRMTVLNLQ